MERNLCGSSDKLQPPPCARPRGTSQRNGGPLATPGATAAGPSLPAQTGPHYSCFLADSASISPSLTSWMKSSTFWSKLTPWNTTGLKFLCSKDLTNRTVTTTSPAMSHWGPANAPADVCGGAHELCVNNEFSPPEKSMRVSKTRSVDGRSFFFLTCFMGGRRTALGAPPPPVGRTEKGTSPKKTKPDVSKKLR